MYVTCERERHCEYCGRMFYALHAARKYCSGICSQRQFSLLKAKRMEQIPKQRKVCKQCGADFRTNDKRKLFCSRKCLWNYHNAKRPTTKSLKRVCPVCSKEFVPMQKRGVGKKYCSSKCRSKACYSRSKGLEWRKKQRWRGNWYAALQRDAFTCMVCGVKYWPSQWTSNRFLIVHHLDGTGETKVKNHDMNNLQTLCNSCHGLFHQNVHLVYVDGEYKAKGKIFEMLGLKEVKTIC